LALQVPAIITRSENERDNAIKSVDRTGVSFDPVLEIGQADLLMRQTDSYPRWLEISQNVDKKTREIANAIIQRDTLLNRYLKGETISWPLFDQLTQQLHNIGISLPTAQQIKAKNNLALSPGIAPSITATPAELPIAHSNSVTSSPSILSEENLLILDLKVPVIEVSNTIMGYGTDTQTFLPLHSVAKILGFPLTVSPEKGIAEGWFIAEDRTFYLNKNTKEILINKETNTWQDNQIVVGEDDIYIDADLLSKWFPVDIEVSFSHLNAVLTPREELPIQAQYEREQKRLMLLRRGDQSLKYTPKEAPYALASFPQIDFSSTLDTNTDSGRQEYSLTAEGDLAYMGAKVYLSGDEEDWFDKSRIRLSRVAYNSDLLGPLRANQIEIGDISPASLSVLGTSSEENGVRISNEDLKRGRDFNTTRFEGNMQPGWDVELYRNKTLVDSIRIGQDGRYIFDDIQLFYGKNTFRVVAFGPQGQQRVIQEKDINIGTEMLPPKAFKYDISASQKNVTVIDDDSYRTDNGQGRFNSNFRYGLTDSLSLSTGVSSVEFADTRHNYMQVGLGGTFSNIYGQADLIHDTASGSGIAFLGQSSYGAVNLKAELELYDNFITEGLANNPLQEKHRLSLYGSYPESSFISDISYGLSTTHSTYKDYDVGSLTANFSGRYDDVLFTNTTGWQYAGSTASADDYITGDVAVTGWLPNGQRISGSASYQVGEDTDLKSLTLSTSKSLSSTLSSYLSLDYSLGNDDTAIIESGLSWDTGQFVLSPSVSYSDEDGVGALLTLSFSLGHNPVSNKLHFSSQKKTGQGSAAALVYHDANNNQKRDKDEPPLEDVQVRSLQTRRNGYTNEQGEYYFNRLTAFSPTDIEINKSTLEDPFWEPSIAGVAVIPRPGQTNRVEIPVVTTGEIDGTILFVDKQGKQLELSRVKVTLTNSEGEIVKTTSSEYDGFFLFDKVFPGTYTLHIAPEDIKANQLPLTEPAKIIIGNDGTISSGNDFLFKEQDEPQKRHSVLPGGLSAPLEANQHQPLAPALDKSIQGSPTESSAEDLTVHVTPQDRKTAYPEVVSENSVTIKEEENKSPSGVSQTGTVSISPLDIVNVVPVDIASNEQKPENLSPSTRPVGSSKKTESQFVSAKRPVPVPEENVMHHNPNNVIIRPLETEISFDQQSDKAASGEAEHSSLIAGRFKPIVPLSGQIITPIQSLEKVSPQNVSPVTSHNQTASGSPTIRESDKKSAKEEVRYSVHLASYKSKESAERGLHILQQQLRHGANPEDFTIMRVDLGPEKGIWFRVMYGRFATKNDADRLSVSFRERTSYAQTLSLDRQREKSVTISPLKFLQRQQQLTNTMVARRYATMLKNS